MRVIGGSLKGRAIRFPGGSSGLRPTSSLVRKAIFDMLYSLASVSGADVVDLYSGTGALGIEALSRGAGRVTFVERNRRAVSGIQRNLTELDLSGKRYNIVNADVMRFLRSSSYFDIAFIDPPYDSNEDGDGGGVPVLCGSVLGILKAGLAVVETRPGRYDFPPGWVQVKSRTYGGTLVNVLRGVMTV
ncbi:MAG: RsmD family RNA methyltransferase [Actinobacteria bacterium]|nr:RsmD family RNA methyltransferase [Actinomycetota bacterium]